MFEEGELRRGHVRGRCGLHLGIDVFSQLDRADSGGYHGHGELDEIERDEIDDDEIDDEKVDGQNGTQEGELLTIVRLRPPFRSNSSPSGRSRWRSRPFCSGDGVYVPVCALPEVKCAGKPLESPLECLERQ